MDKALLLQDKTQNKSSQEILIFSLRYLAKSQIFSVFQIVNGQIVGLFFSGLRLTPLNPLVVSPPSISLSFPELI